MSRIHTSILIVLALLVGPSSALAQDDDQLTLNELQKLVLEQQKQLEKQQELLEQ